MDTIGEDGRYGTYGESIDFIGGKIGMRMCKFCEKINAVGAGRLRTS